MEARRESAMTKLGPAKLKSRTRHGFTSEETAPRHRVEDPPGNLSRPAEAGTGKTPNEGFEKRPAILSTLAEEREE